MRKISEAISRLTEIEGQLKCLREPHSLDPDWPEVLEQGLLAEDIRKAREAIEDLRDKLDVLNKAISHLSLAEQNLSSTTILVEPGGNVRMGLREINTEVRRARMKIEEITNG